MILLCPGCLKMLHLKDIAPAALNNMNTQFTLLDKGRTTLEGQSRTCMALVADETAAAHFQFWGDECDAFKVGDIIHLSNGIFSYNRNTLVLRAGKRGTVEKVGEFTMTYAETPNMSEIKWVPDPNYSKTYVWDSVIFPYSVYFPPNAWIRGFRSAQFDMSQFLTYLSSNFVVAAELISVHSLSLSTRYP